MNEFRCVLIDEDVLNVTIAEANYVANCRAKEIERSVLFSRGRVPIDETATLRE